MEAVYQHKLDPRLRRVAEHPVQVFVEVANAETAQWIADQPWVSNLVQVVDGYYTATVAPDRVTELAGRDGVIEVEAVRFLRPQLNRSLDSIRGRELVNGNGAAWDGRGVVIGIVDYGLDFTLKDFQNPTDGRVRDAHNSGGLTRIAYLWDQELERKGNERAPRKYDYGVEYTSQDIDAALRANEPGLIRHNPLHPEKPLQGHGTHVAGIAAGNGETADRRFPAGKYVGVAPAATLVFVSLNRRAVLSQVGAPGGTLANSVNLAHAIAYCFEQADKLGLPCVVNLSMGFNGGGHDGNTAVEWIIDTLLQKSGRAVVFAAGNEDGAGQAVHATGRLKRGEEARLEWQIGFDGKDDPTPNEIEVWYPSGSRIKVQLVSPGDRQESTEVQPGESGVFSFVQGEEVVVHSDAATPWNGAARIHIQLSKGSRTSGVRRGTWIVRLEAGRVAPGEPKGRVRFDAWIERTVPAGGPPNERSRFKRFDPRTAITLTTPSTARQAIAVASYANNGSPRAPISGFSGRGPTRDGRPKPELAAPGDPVFSTNAHAGHQENGRVRGARIKFSGTSMAAPHVAGVVARMLGRNAYLTAEEIRALLIESARGTQWSPKGGYGKVDAERAVELVEQRVGLRRPLS